LNSSPAAETKRTTKARIQPQSIRGWEKGEAIPDDEFGTLKRAAEGKLKGADSCAKFRKYKKKPL